MGIGQVLTTLIVSVLVVACASAPTPTATLPPAPTPTNVPTSTPRATETLPAPATATRRPTETPTATPCVSSLRECAERKHIQIGTEFRKWWFPDPKWREIVGREFNLAIIDDGLYWSEIEPQRGQFDFSFVDQQVALARAKNMAVCGHPLVWPTDYYEGVADWVVKGNFSRDDLAQILRNHIIGVMSHYKGQISCWIVVEEPYLNPNRPEDIFYRQFGYDYIDLAFQTAREADPSAMLIYNDGDNHTANGTTTPLTRQTVQRLKLKGLVDGVGLQMYLDGTSPPNKQDVIATMQSYGVPVHVTELNVNLKNVTGTREERYAKQARIFKEAFEACLESGVCKSCSVWGIGDKYHFLKDSRYIGSSPNADPTPFDDDLNSKPAYFALLDVLR